MRKNIEKVLTAFASKKPANGQTCSSSGIALYSYDMKIGQWLPDGSLELIEYASGPSKTTKSHIRAAELALKSYSPVRVSELHGARFAPG